jgi:DNA-binding MarR family transcriptional regulator
VIRSATSPGGSTTKPERPPNVMFLLRQAAHYAERAVDDAVRDHDITAAQLGVLNRLARHPGLSGAELARELLCTPQAAQLAIASLERRGLVRRKPDPNHGRTVRNSLTAKGRRVVERSLADAYLVQDGLLSVLTAEEQQAITYLLERFISQAGHPDGGGAPAKRTPRS